MAFQYYGPGNWGLGGTFNLPEFGITEKLFGGNTQSLNDANSNFFGSIDPSMPVPPNPVNLFNYTGNSGDVAGTTTTGTPSGSAGATSGSSSPSISGEDYKNSGYDVDDVLSEMGVSRAYYDKIKSSGQVGDVFEFADWYANKQEEDAINSAYDQGSDFLNSQEQNLRSGEQDFYNTYTGAYDAQIPLINQAKDQGISATNLAASQAQLGEQNALAAARNLFNELTQRNRQAFGGSALSSVGQASNEILGRSAQQQFGDIRNQAGQTIQKIQAEARNIENQAMAKVQELTLMRDTALSEAKLAFKDKIAEIERMKYELGQNKAQAKLEALRAFRDRTAQVQAQTTAFLQNIQLMKTQADLNLRNALASVQGQVGTSMGNTESAYNDLGNEISSANQNFQASNMMGGGSQAATPFSIFGANPMAGNNEEDVFNSARSLFNRA